MDFKIVYIKSGCVDKDTFFDELNSACVKVDKDYNSLEDVLNFFSTVENDNIHLVLYKGCPFTIQGSYKKTSGWGFWIRFNFRKEDQGKYGIAMESEKIRGLNIGEVKDILTELIKAIEVAINKNKEG